MTDIEKSVDGQYSGQSELYHFRNLLNVRI